MTSHSDVSGDEIADLFAARGTASSERERQLIESSIVEQTLPFASRLAARFRSRGVDLDELEAVAGLALVAAMRRFDASSGSFLPFAHATITGELKKHFRDHAWAMRPPRAVQELRPRLQVLLEERRATGGDTSSEAMADELGSTRRLVVEARHAGGCFTLRSIDASGDGGHGPSDMVADDVDAFETVDDHDLLQRCCTDLTSDEARLLDLRFTQELSQSAIGEQIGISQMQVSRRLAALLTKLRSRLDGGPVAPAA